jgi:hypothetical protein
LKAIDDRLQRPCYLRRVHHGSKIRSRKQRADTGKYVLVSKTIQLWSQLPADALEVVGSTLDEVIELRDQCIQFLQPHNGPVHSASERNEYQKIFLEVKRIRHLRLTT